MSVEAFKFDDAVAVVDPVALALPAIDVAPRLGEVAAPDVPAVVGWALIGAFGLIMLGMLTFFTGSGEAVFMAGVCIVYLAVYVGAPVVFLRIEKRGGRTDLDTFLEKGLETWTGHVGGRAAITQILLLPTAVAVAICGMGIVVRIFA